MEESQNELAQEIQQLKTADKNPEEQYLNILSKIDELRNEILDLKRKGE
jgi:formate dehydrogenase maturation protein FdhE